MSNTIAMPTYARPGGVILIREGRKTPLELAFEGLDHRGFGLWTISTRLRRTDEISVSELGFNFIRAEYEPSKSHSPLTPAHN